MNKIGSTLLAAAMTMAPGIAAAQDINAVTADGRTVLLHNDGTWSFGDAASSDQAGKVNVLLANIRDTSSSCRVQLQYENLTDIFFGDFAPGVLMIDRSGYAVGDGCGVGMENLRPNGIATCQVYASNVPCGDIDAVVVSGWQYCEIDGRRDSSGRICDPYLNVVPSSHEVQLIKR